MHYAEYEEGEIIISNGDIGEYFYFLFEGELNIGKKYFGTEALLNLPYLYNIISITKTKLARISRHDCEMIKKRAKLRDPEE